MNANSDATRADGVMKILADGTQVPASDPHTDHELVLFPDGTMITAFSLGPGPDDPEAPEDADEPPFDSQEDALAAIAKLNELKSLQGYSDWKLASIEDYERYVIDRSRFNPAADPNLFPGLEPSWHWSSTPAAWSSASAWLVGFSYGSVAYYHRGHGGFALAVRRAGQ